MMARLGKSPLELWRIAMLAGIIALMLLTGVHDYDDLIWYGLGCATGFMVFAT
jgi:hypothetical protein